MGIKQDIEDNLKEFPIIKINGQPTDEDLNKLKSKLSKLAASIPTMEEGNTDMWAWLWMMLSIELYPGPYPTMVDPNTVTRERQVAKHKAELQEFETYLGVENVLWIKIKEAVDPEWLEAIESATLGFTHITPMQCLLTCEVEGLNWITLMSPNSWKNSWHLEKWPRILQQNLSEMTESNVNLSKQGSQNSQTYILH